MNIIKPFERILPEIAIVAVTILIVVVFYGCWSTSASDLVKALLVLTGTLVECVTVYFLTRLMLAKYKRDGAVYNDDFSPLACTHIICCVVLAIVLSFIAAELAWIIPVIVLMVVAFFVGSVLIGYADEAVFRRN